MKKILLLSLSLFCSSLYAAEELYDASLEDILNMQTEVKTDVGSRNGAKNFLSSAVPVDVVTCAQIENSGLTSLTDILRYFIAGFNAPETSVADGSDHIRAYTLRGMSPDQILVLVNGKRVHSSALLHVNGTIGRGSSNVDLDTIAPASIERVEILRDGAAAQYGSDAISGVINIILKGVGHQNKLSIHAGKRLQGDGTQLNADAFVSVPLKYDGFFNLTLQAKNQEPTNRSGDGITHVGIATSQNFLALFNAELPQEGGTNFYANSILNYRDSKASAFYREANATEAGFLPQINAKVLDYALTLGATGEIASGIFWDLSNTYGLNQIDYYVTETKNYSLANNSPRNFSNGGLAFTQNTTNFDLKKGFDTLKLSAGAEFRYENYKIKAGEENSYINGGSQGFVGYTPSNATDDSRTSYALYLDTTYTPWSTFFSELALRYENFSDFGSATNAKIAFSYKPTKEILLRTSMSSGFRAPSLAQSNYSHTSTFGGNVEGTFKTSDPVAIALGAQPLRAENSQHFTIGSVYQPNKETSFSIDYFYTGVHDRIMLSNEFNTSTIPNVDKARFFTNAIDTQTEGVDIKYNYKHTFSNNSLLDFGIWYNYNQTKVVGFNNAATNRTNSYEQIDRVENGQAKQSAKILSAYTFQKLTSTLNINHYGSYSEVIDTTAYKFDPAWTVDLDLNYKASKNVSIALGGQNIFNTLPNKWKNLATSSSHYGYNDIKPYSRYSPFGYSGAYYYVRATMRF